MAEINKSSVNRLSSVIETLKDSTISLILIVIFFVSILIIPLPIVFLDFFQIINISIALMIMITVLNSKKVLEFSTFPTILLFTTVFRLAVNVSSTRLILTQGEAFSGKVIGAFANFVIGGNFLVGLIIFIVITTVLFMVVTKGATRVSEVSARFQLDAMPQKQLAIDTELSQGLINENQAKEKREMIQKEAAFYGNMDGASKFVSGDVKVGLIITLINIIGGIITGVAIRGEAIQNAMESYVILSIGDGLVSQIPSLLISTASGVIVTRNISESKLGDDVKTEMFSKPSTFYLAGLFVFFLAFFPGFPMFVFLLLAGILFYFGYVTSKNIQSNKDRDTEKENKKQKDLEKQKEDDYYNPEKMGELLYVDQIELEIGYNLIPLVDEKAGGDLLDRIKKMRKQLVMDLGLIVPQIRLTDNMKLEAENYEIKLGGITIGGGDIRIGKLLALPSSADAKIDGEETIEPVFNLKAYWINEDDKDDAERNGFNIFDGSTIVATHLTELIKRHAGDILSRKDVQNILNGIAKRNEPLMEEIKKINIRNGELQKILQMLLSENISIRNIDLIMEGICDYYTPGVNFFDLYENIRYALKRQISSVYSDENKNISVVNFKPAIESQLKSMLIEIENGYALNLDANLHQKLMEVLSEKINTMREKGYQDVILIDRNLRMSFKKLFQKYLPSLVVLSHLDIAEDYKVNVVDTI